MTLELGIDITIILLLAATIVYARILNKRIISIQENREQIQQILVEFSQTLDKAEKSIGTLRTAGQEALGNIEERVQHASSIRDDLSYLVEKGEKIANELEFMVRDARGAVAENAAPPETPPPSNDEDEVYLQEDAEDEGDMISEVKKKLIGRLKNLK
ncbi:MAG: DUF6468 domain-containing protein [Alphaproteobacteria bacterium]